MRPCFAEERVTDPQGIPQSVLTRVRFQRVNAASKSSTLIAWLSVLHLGRKDARSVGTTGNDEATVSVVRSLAAFVSLALARVHQTTSLCRTKLSSWYMKYVERSYRTLGPVT